MTRGEGAVSWEGEDGLITLDGLMVQVRLALPLLAELPPVHCGE